MNMSTLLQKKNIVPDTEVISPLIRGKCVLVTGAGGSIGSELSRQLLRLNPSKLLLLGRGEHSIAKIYNELCKEENGGCAVPVIADIQNRRRLEYIFTEHSPHLVFHTAAYKHVDLMERSPEEAIQNNVFGTLNVAELSLRHGTDIFVQISSDKAVNPTSVYGATKKISEDITRGMALKGGGSFVVVRFGNVIGSRGSVIPIFERQIRQGGPLTITHPDMERYFMSIDEAAYLVLQSCAVAKSGQVCVLDMGDPVKIVDVARDMIEMSGMRPDIDIKIEFTGLRPGEKLKEELSECRELLRATEWGKILIDEVREVDAEGFLSKVDEMRSCISYGNSQRVLDGLRELVPSYTPTDTILNKKTFK